MIRLIVICWCLMVPLLQGAPLIYAEYVISSGNPDNDPGLGNGTEIALAANAGAAVLSVSIPPAELSLNLPGTYLLSVRVKDSDDNWTLMTRTFQVAAPLPSLPESGPLSHVEAYVSAAEVPNDLDPGQATPLLFPPTSPAPDGQYSRVFSPSDLSALAPGVYRLAARARSVGGLWSTPIARTFVVPGATAPQFYYARWRVRNTHGNIVQSGAFSNEPLTSFPKRYASNLPISGASPGLHTLEVSLEDLLGAPGLVVNDDFQVVTHDMFWDEMYFTDPLVRANPNISGPSADPNGDGVTNAMAYVLGLNPEQSHHAILRSLAGPIGSPRAKLNLPHVLPAGGLIRIEGSVDLISGFSEITEVSPPMVINTNPAFSSTLGHDLSGGFPELYLTPPAGGTWDARGFFRLKVEYAGGWPLSP
jgi:hypothetical protein